MSSSGGGLLSDAFVAKYSVIGALIWAADLVTGSSGIYPSGIAVDGSGNVYTTGYSRHGQLRPQRHPQPHLQPQRQRLREQAEHQRQLRLGRRPRRRADDTDATASRWTVRATSTPPATSSARATSTPVAPSTSPVHVRQGQRLRVKAGQQRQLPLGRRPRRRLQRRRNRHRGGRLGQRLHHRQLLRHGQLRPQRHPQPHQPQRRRPT